MGRLLTLLLLITSCTQFIQSTDDDYFEVYSEGDNEKLNLFFSHNIHGETHPCGCRKFPLGGIPQIYGAIKSEIKDKKYIYVDTGDSFFPSSAIPESIHKSSRYTAEKLAESFDSFGLKMMTPGSYDFALGQEFLAEIAKKHKFKFLITNASKTLKIKYSNHVHIKYGEMNLFFVGIVNPEVLPDKLKAFFDEPISRLKEELKRIEDLKNIKNKKIVLMSHSGMDFDVKLANLFPQISWIIGAHSQSFLKQAKLVNKTSIVQALSRNHYLGLIKIAPLKEGKDEYKLIDVKEDLKDAISPNPYIAWLDEYKKEVDKIQEIEQNFSPAESSNTSYPTSTSCMDCHDNQVKFWQGTAHALGFKTLIDAKANNNPSCVGCHSLGFQDKKGFLSTKTIIKSGKDDFDINQYWTEFNSKIKTKKSIRELSSTERLKYSQEWIKLDESHQVTANHANIQCLHCHDKTSEHPFDSSTKKQNHNYQAKCLNCHTTDQSPEWYNKDSKGLAKDINDAYFGQKLKAVSCPKIEK